MPYQLTVDPARDLVLGVISGEVTREEVFGFRRELVSNPDFHPGMSQLLDFRGARFLPDLPFLSSMAEDDPFAPGARRALVVPDQVHFGIARAYGMLSGHEGEGMHIFHDWEEACAWLGIEHPDPRG